MVCGSAPDQVSSGSDWICSSLSPYHPSCVLEVKFQSLTLPWHFCLRLLRVLDGSEELWPTVPQSTPDLINIVLFLSKIKTKKERKKERKKETNKNNNNNKTPKDLYIYVFRSSCVCEKREIQLLSTACAWTVSILRLAAVCFF